MTLTLQTPVRKTIELRHIQVDMRINVRDVDNTLIQAYRADMRAYGEDAWQMHWKEALKIVSEGFLYGGFHTYYAAYAEFGEVHNVTVNVQGTTWKDAYALACGENATHGKRRTNREKRAAIKRLLLDNELNGWANGYIADMTKTSIGLVRCVEKELAEKHPEWERPRTRRRKSGVGVATCPERKTPVKERSGKVARKQAVVGIHADRNAAWTDVNSVYEKQPLFKHVPFQDFLEKVHAAKPPKDSEVTTAVLCPPETYPEDSFSHTAIIHAAVYLKSLLGVLQTEHPPTWFQQLRDTLREPLQKRDAPETAVASVEMEESLPATFVAVLDTLEKLTAHNFIAGYQNVLHPAEETAGNIDGEWGGEVFEIVNALQTTLAQLDSQQTLLLALLRAYPDAVETPALGDCQVPSGGRSPKVSLKSAFCD